MGLYPEGAPRQEPVFMRGALPPTIVPPLGAPRRSSRLSSVLCSIMEQKTNPTPGRGCGRGAVTPARGLRPHQRLENENAARPRLTPQERG